MPSRQIRASKIVSPFSLLCRTSPPPSPTAACPWPVHPQGIFRLVGKMDYYLSNSPESARLSSQMAGPSLEAYEAARSAGCPEVKRLRWKPFRDYNFLIQLVIQLRCYFLRLIWRICSPKPGRTVMNEHQCSPCRK